MHERREELITWPVYPAGRRPSSARLGGRERRQRISRRGVTGCHPAEASQERPGEGREGGGTAQRRVPPREDAQRQRHGTGEHSARAHHPTARAALQRLERALARQLDRGTRGGLGERGADAESVQALVATAEELEDR